ncbi:MAG: preprotein translocase subunit SecE [Bosea sp.]|jgi:preprotein translocase subunit SecE|uniref:Protein translocase subunit SecE n=1 Tax=Kaistia geumhonensis TaxID=410839 RepID=A0ABU0MCM1_9HYPH|nr:preprotein translocase subunit SecE [Kaistia geumhonensis]MBN9430845.1 preprotein translocase subunit SecE [Bosea sp. (in: a-proteobacteria)]MCX5481633.1 preprotein translocase subunit SecE [Kaistia geumhonensis]MDQ0518688.1 preprotein translocase subunit SecE [Kaistia geumhonensis]
MATKTNPLTFLQQVRTEVSKVVWPSRREALITTAMVFAMAVAASLFFTLVDFGLSWGVQLLLGLGR